MLDNIDHNKVINDFTL